MSNHSNTGQYYPDMPVPFQRGCGPVHPDGYQTTSRSTPAAQQRYGSGNDYTSLPNQCRVEVSFPSGQQSNDRQPNYGYPGAPSMVGGYTTGNGYAAQGALYGNPVTIRVSNPDWVGELLRAMQQQQEIDLVFDALEVVRQLVQAVREQVGSFADIVARRAREAIGFAMVQNAPRGYNQQMAEAMLAPVVVAAIIGAITLVGMAIIYAVIVLVGQRNQIDAIRAAAAHCRYGIKDVEVASQNQGKGSDSWFDFLNGAIVKIRCNEQ